MTRYKREWPLQLAICVAVIAVIELYHTVLPKLRKASLQEVAHTSRHLRPACELAGVTYKSSVLEKRWIQNVLHWQDSLCEHTGQFSDDVTAWLAGISSSELSQKIDEMDHNIFSYFEHTYVCGGTRKTAKSWIEPLSHALRHPNALCAQADTVDRGYLLLATRKGVEHTQRHACSGRNCQNIMIDVGASTWNAGAGGPSQSWFNKAYQQHGIEFDRYVLWEASPISDAAIFKDLPAELWHKYQYFNLPASADVTNPASPINVLKRIAQPGDFVVFKLDIDNYVVESQILADIMSDPALAALIDEFVYEEHVNFRPMVSCCWKGTVNPNLTLYDSYQHFLQLRLKGIRAHSWV